MTLLTNAFLRAHGSQLRNVQRMSKTTDRGGGPRSVPHKIIDNIVGISTRRYWLYFVCS